MHNGRKRQIKHIMGNPLVRDLEAPIWRWTLGTSRWAWREGGVVYRESLVGALHLSGMTATSFTEAVALTVGYEAGVVALAELVGRPLDSVEKTAEGGPTGQ